MTEDKIQRIKLYAKHATDLGQVVTIRGIANHTRVTQWELLDLIERDRELTFWSVTKDGIPIRRQGLWRVEFVTQQVVAQ